MSRSDVIQERVEALKGSLFFRGVADEALQAIAESGTDRMLERGEILFHEHQPPLGLIVITRGALKVYKLDFRGRELTLRVENAGSSVAEVPLFDGGNYPATAEALENSTTVFVVAPARFHALMALHPAIAVQATRALAIRSRTLVHMLEVQALHSVRARLAEYLVEAAAGRESFVLSHTNDEIANRLGTVREVVSRSMKFFRQNGIIAVQNRTVTILNPTALNQIAAGEESDAA